MGKCGEGSHGALPYVAVKQHGPQAETEMSCGKPESQSAERTLQMGGSLGPS